jgi:hypothetical protein
MSTNVQNCINQCEQGDLPSLAGTGLECRDCCYKSCGELTTCSGSGTGKRIKPAPPPSDGGMTCDECRTICRMQNQTGANCTCLQNCE